MNSWLWAALAAVGGAALWYIMTMNRFARLLVKIRESDSGIEVALTRRFDTLTRMLDVTRAYARHEAGTLGSIVKMRQGMSMAQWSDANSQMDVLHGKINVLAEAYPELRSSENFRVLQASIAEIEEELQSVRRIYNMNVSQFNQICWQPGRTALWGACMDIKRRISLRLRKRKNRMWQCNFPCNLQTDFL